MIGHYLKNIQLCIIKMFGNIVSFGMDKLSVRSDGETIDFVRIC